MIIKSYIGVFILRTICIIIITASIYKFDVNPVLFGFIIVIFTLLLLLSGTNSMELSENEVIFKFQRLIPVCARIKSINLKEINSIQFSEGKIDDTALLLNILIEYIPGTIRSDDEIVVELSNGEIYRHAGIGTKNEIIDLIVQINKKIKRQSNSI